MASGHKVLMERVESGKVKGRKQGREFCILKTLRSTIIKNIRKKLQAFAPGEYIKSGNIYDKD